jgi:chromosome segregation ATPase
VSTKKFPILKHWLATGSVAFVAGCGCSLPFTQNLAHSGLCGLATIPGLAASSIVRSRHRHQQLHRQLERGKLRLNELQQRSEIGTRQLQLQRKDRQEIEIKVAQLQNLATSLTDRIDRERQQYQQLEYQLASLVHYCQEQQNFATKLDRSIQDKQAQNLEVTTDFNRLKTEIAQFQAAKLHIIGEIDRSKILLQNIHSEIERCRATKQELTLEMQQVQARQDLDNGSLDRSIDRQQQLIQELDTTIANRQQTQQHLTAELDRLAQIVATRSTELVERDRELVTVQQQLNDTESALIVKQVELDELVAEISIRNDELESSSDYLAQKLQQRELKISQLELNSRQAELDNLDLKIQAKRQEIDDIDLEEILQIFEPKPPNISRKIERIERTGSWHEKFIDNPHLPVLQHIEKHGTITEAEASNKLGNARSVRQFANKLEEYTQDLPFSIRVESSPKGNRYLKETQN